MTPRELYEHYASAVAYVVVETPAGDQAIGSAFHVGEGVFVTARHVVEGNKIVRLATTESLIVPDPNGGFMAVLTVEPIYECLARHRILPRVQNEPAWGGLWDYLPDLEPSTP